MENKKSPSGDIISSKKNNNNIKARLIFSFDLTKDISNPKFILQDLKLEIKKSYSIQDNEYDLFIGAKNKEEYVSKLNPALKNYVADCKGKYLVNYLMSIILLMALILV